MLGRSVASRIIYIRPVGGPENSWNKGDYHNVISFVIGRNTHVKILSLQIYPMLLFGKL